MEDILQKYIEASLLEKFEFYNCGHAIEILSESFPIEWAEILECLRGFSLTMNDIIKAGGNKSPIPVKFDEALFPHGWQEVKITGDLHVNQFVRASRKGSFKDLDALVINGFIDGHNIDFVKGKVAFDLEWNSKDQTFDRDLLAMRTYFDCSLIDVGVIITRAEDLNDIFKTIPLTDGKTLLSKYGASTTWMGKLVPRLISKRNGSCPILGVGIKKGCVIDFNE